MSSDRSSLAYRPCAGAVLINRAGLVFAGRRAGLPADDATAWQMPQGGIDAGEQPLDAALRELFEETSVHSVKLMAESVAWLSYDVPDSLASGRFQKKWRGQTQKWFAFRFLGPDSEIDILRPGGGAFTAEFDAWDWLPLTELPGRVVAFKRPIYEALVAEFAALAVPA